MVEWAFVPDLIVEIVNEVAQYIKKILAAVQNSMIKFLRALNQTLETLTSLIINKLKAILNTAIDYLSELFTEVGDYFRRIYDDISISIGTLTNGIIERVSTFIGDMVDYIDNLVSQAINFIKDIASDASTLLYDVYNDVASNISRLFSDTADSLYDVLFKITTGIDTLIDSATAYLSNIFKTVADGVSNIINSANDIVVKIGQGINDFIEKVLDVAGNTLTSLLETISNLPGEIADLRDQLIASAKENIADPIINFPTNLIDEIMTRVAGQPLKDADKMNLDMLNIAFGESPVTRSPEMMRDKINQYMPEHPALRALVVAVLSPFIVLSTMSGITQANAQIILQEHALVNPYRLIEPGDVIRARHFDLISQSDATDELRKTGYTESAAATLLSIGQVVPPVGELVSWFLRDLISEEQFKEGLARSGWNETDTATLQEAAFFIPPVNDLITMAVREVFTPDIAERFGQFEDFPPQFVEHAKKQGVNEDWAKRYWGAHWALPSVQMGFEMLHRNVINQDDLTLLMRASDIMPFWRDKLIEISYSPLTRVDIRRMHKVGVIDEERVNRAYHDIGYNDENASLLTDFTLALNAEEPIEVEVALSDLTRSNIIGFFTDGIILRDQAVDLLAQAGIDSASSELFVVAAELDLERKDRKDAIAIVVNQAKSGSITFDQAEDNLNELGLEELEKQKAITNLNKIESSRNKLPSKTDLDKMLTNVIIDDDTYRETMALIGYNETWTERYLELIRSADNAA